MIAKELGFFFFCFCFFFKNFCLVDDHLFDGMTNCRAEFPLLEGSDSIPVRNGLGFGEGVVLEHNDEPGEGFVSLEGSWSFVRSRDPLVERTHMGLPEEDHRSPVISRQSSGIIYFS